MSEDAKYNLIVHICQVSLKALPEFGCLFALPGVNAIHMSGQLRLSTQGGFNLRMKILHLNALGIRLFQKVQGYWISFRGTMMDLRQSVSHHEFLDLDFQKNCKKVHTKNGF